MPEASDGSTTSSTDDTGHLERVVLSAALSADAAFDEIENAGVRPSDFNVPQLRFIFQAMRSVRSKGERIDSVTVLDELKARKMLDRAGGGSALGCLQALAASTGMAATYARRLKALSDYRRIVDLLHEFQRQAIDRDAPPAEILTVAIDALFRMQEQTRGDFGEVDRRAVLNQLLEGIGKKAPRGIPTGFRALDGILGGLKNGNLIYIGARPSIGKTTLAHQLLASIADTGVITAFFSLEMTGEELLEREIVAKSRIPRANWRAENEERVAGDANRLVERPLRLFDLAGLDVAGIHSRARRLKNEGVGLIGIDYIGLIKGGRRHERRQAEVGEISRSLKRMAGDLKIPVVVCAQLNRDCEDRKDFRPMLSDLRESGDLEQDANVVVLLHRPEFFLKEKTPNDERGIAEIIVAKHRNGPTGTVKLRFHGPTMTFHDLDEPSRAP